MKHRKFIDFDWQFVDETPKPDNHQDLNRGDIFTMQEFIASVEDGFLIDYDGYGNYLIKDAQASWIITDCIVKPSDLKRNLLDETLDGVLWYNK